MSCELPDRLTGRDAESISALIADRLRSGRQCVVRIGSDSMLPLLAPGDKVLLAPCRGEDIECGDLAAFERDGAIVLHRVLKREGGQLLEKGDNARLASLIPLGSVLGRATGVAAPIETDLTSSRNRRLAKRAVSIGLWEHRVGQSVRRLGLCGRAVAAAATWMRRCAWRLWRAR